MTNASKKNPSGKSLSAPSSARGSPVSQQGKITTMLQTEAAVEDIGEPTLYDVMKEIQEMRKDLKNLRIELLETQRTTIDNKQKIGVLEEGAAEMKEEIRELQKENVEFSGYMSKVEFERMSFFLRFQNVVEKEGEDLRDLMSTILADYIKKNKEYLWGEIDLIYRINSAYARMNEVPREIHIKFLRRSTRDEILRAQREVPLQYEQKDISILKQIPKKIRETRRKYSFLSKKLYKNGIWFKWLMPEGMLVFWDGGRIRIRTVGEAEAFLKKHASILGDEQEGTGGAMALSTGGKEEEDTIAKRLRSQK